MKQDTMKSDGTSSNQISPDSVKNIMASVNDLRAVIHHLRNPKSVEGVDSETINRFMVSKVNQIDLFLSQLQTSVLKQTSQPEAVTPPCMDFLISSAIDKVMQNTVKELIAFDGAEAPLVHEHIGSPTFGRYLDQFLISTREMIARDPKFMDNFEVNVRKRFLDLLIKKIQKSTNYSLRQQFDLV